MKNILAVFFMTGFLTLLAENSGTFDAPLRISLPNKSWALQLSASGFTIRMNGPKASGRWGLLAENGVSVISVTLEQVSKAANLSTCRDDILRRGHPQGLYTVKGSKLKQRGDMLILEYTIEELQGQSINEKNVRACLPKDDVYIDIHLSKASFEPADQAKLDAILDSVRIVANPSKEGEVQVGYKR
ncbi:MAG: hypothetical protein WDO18_14470 [Acidobacteriota bacterium]